MLTAFLPCRKGSQRIPDKNIKPFAGFEYGLIEIKISQLLECSQIDKIILSSNDERIISYAKTINSRKIHIDKRPDWLGANETTTDQLINYVPELISQGDVLWTHVTSPFINAESYNSIINAYYREESNGFDSLMTVKKIQGFLWDKNGAINYNRSQEKWPRTQTLDPIYEIDSGAFIAPIDVYKNKKDRIGVNPFLFVNDNICSVDIDWPEDFIFAEHIFKSRVVV